MSRKEKAVKIIKLIGWLVLISLNMPVQTHAAWSTAGVTLSTSDTGAGRQIKTMMENNALQNRDPALFSALNSLPTPSQKKSAIETMSPSSSVTGIQGGLGSGLSMRSGTTQIRIGKLQSGHLSSLYGSPEGPGGPSDNVLAKPGIWGKAIGSYGEQGKISGVKGYDYETMGVMFGADRRLDSNNIFGANIGYLTTGVDSDGGQNSNTDVNTLILGLYGLYSPDNWYIDYGFDYGFGQVETSRDVAIGSLRRTTTGDTNAASYSLYVNYGHMLFKDTYVLTPFVGAQISDITVDGYTETGAGGANLQVQEINSTLFNTSLGMKYERMTTDALKIKARAIWTHEWSDDLQSSVMSRFTGAGSSAAYFETKGIDVGDDKLTLGLGAKYQLNTQMTIDFDYDLEVAEEFNSHTGTMEFKYKF